MKNTEYLFDDFNPVSKEEWLAKIVSDLKGRSLEDLQANAAGLRLDPFPHSDDLKALPEAIDDRTGWEIGEDITLTDDPATANRQLLHVIENGVVSPRFILEKVPASQDLSTLLENVDPAGLDFHFMLKNLWPDADNLLSAVDAWTGQSGHSPGIIQLAIHAGENVRLDRERMCEWIKKVLDSAMNIKGYTISGRLEYNDESVINELAGMMSQGADWLAAGAEAGLDPEAVSRTLQFSLHLGKNYFLQIARIRALKLLWANVLKGWSVAATLPPKIDAYIAGNELTDDPNNNMIANTTIAMSAVIGGAGRLTVRPATKGEGNRSGFSRRIARNVQHILKMESHMDRVADPAAGSYFVETLTSQLASAAWEEFRKTARQ